jgi:ABC-type transport system involved in multi-copper enzyme maturation permease subunit
MNSIFQIAINTFREIIRGKLTILLLAFGISVVGLSAVFGSVSLGDREKVIIDFGLFSISILTVGLSVLAGASLMQKEISQKTAYNILSKPVGRWQLVFGKYLGLLMSVSIMTCFMGTILSFLITWLTGQFSSLIMEASMFIIFELVIVTAVTTFFSAALVTPTLVGIFAFAIFIIGRSIEYLPGLLELNINLEAATHAPLFIETIYWVMPHLSEISIINGIPYGMGASAAQFLTALSYSTSYAAITLLLACVIFSRRNFT